MNASFEEKSVWIQLISMVVGLGFYFVVAGRMLLGGIDVLPAFMPMFFFAVMLIVIVNVAGHIVVAVLSRPDGRDERDRLIGWRSESQSAWILAVGVIAAISGLIFSIPNVWIAHLLLLFLFISEVVKEVSQLYFYSRGV